jgi:hypothetical protein
MMTEKKEDRTSWMAREVSDMMQDNKGSNAINKHRCNKKGCLTSPILCKWWMCPDYTR